MILWLEQNRCHFVDNISKWIFLKKIYSDPKFIIVCSLGFSGQKVSIGLGNGLAQDR